MCNRFSYSYSFNGVTRDPSIIARHPWQEPR
jgi:hypothetical protein